MLSTLRHLIAIVLLGLALSGVALAIPQRLAPEPSAHVQRSQVVARTHAAPESARRAPSHANPAASITRDSRAPADWRAALLLLIVVYAAAFALARGLFDTDSEPRAIRIS